MENKKEEMNKPEMIDEVFPISEKDRTLGLPSNFAIWFACNLVTTTMLTGMLMIPGVTFGNALRAIVIGCVVGIVPLVLVGVIGQKTGLVTMVALRATFGTRGAVIPSAINVIILVAWSWAQAGLGGLALNYALKSVFRIDAPSVCVIITEVVVVAVALYAIKGISLYEKIAMVLIVVIMGAVIVKAFSSTGMANIFDIAEDPAQGITAISVFDIVVATALSWTPLSADYNRNCKSVRGSVVGTGAGWALGTILSMGSGALMVGMILAGNLNLSYEPSEVFGEIGFGLAGAAVIFLSIIAANVMCIYSATMSFINAFPRLTYKKTAIVIGIVCIVGALFSGILDVFFNFVNLIGTLFMPIFAIMIADFFVIQKRVFNIDAIIYPKEHRDYHYTGGFNGIALAVFVVAVVFAYVIAFIRPVPIGATVPTFFVAFFLYVIIMKLAPASGRRRGEQ